MDREDLETWNSVRVTNTTLCLLPVTELVLPIERCSTVNCPRFDQDYTRNTPGIHQDLPRIRPGYDEDYNRNRLGLDQDLTRIKPGFEQDQTRI